MGGSHEHTHLLNIHYIPDTMECELVRKYLVTDFSLLIFLPGLLEGTLDRVMD